MNELETRIKEHVIRNFEKYRCGQFPGDVHSKEKLWAFLKAKDIHELLKNCSRSCSKPANHLLELMSTNKWTIEATAHEGGTNPNAPLHFNIRIKKSRAHHLNCREIQGKGLFIYQITQRL